jgi:squalene synthase HpnC
VYAYCRVSDDLGDEVPDRATAMRLLDTWGAMLNECYDAPDLSRHPVFVALRPSIVACDLPREPFLNLLRAFKADQVKTRFAALQEDIEYSSDSANPVGALVLYLCGYRDPAMHALSDKTCTALQLANFWQDVGEDLRERDRVYLPQDRLAKYWLDDEFLKRGVENDAYRAMVRELCVETRAMLLQGAPLIDQVDRELAATLRLFTQGGLAILDAIAAIDYNTLSRRIEVSKSAKMKLLAGAALSKLGIHRGSRGLR